MAKKIIFSVFFVTCLAIAFSFGTINAQPALADDECLHACFSKFNRVIVTNSASSPLHVTWYCVGVDGQLKHYNQSLGSGQSHCYPFPPFATDRAIEVRNDKGQVSVYYVDRIRDIKLPEIMR